MAIFSAAWDCVGGRHSQQRHRGMAKLAADRDGLLCLAWRLFYDTSSKDDANNNLDCWLGGRGCVRGWCKEMMSTYMLRAWIRWLMGIVGNEATPFIILMMVIQYTDPQHGVLRWTWRGHRVWCLLRGDRARWSPMMGMARPRACVFVVATTKQTVRGLVCGVVVALRQWVPHGGGPLCAVSLIYLSARSHILTSTA